MVESREHIPNVFISYSWDDAQHKSWVRSLAARLRSDGLNVTLDQWNLQPGDQLPAFMEREVRCNDFVLIICTPNYKAKSDARTGGVGYEGDVIQAEVFAKHNHRKFIPILRMGAWIEAAPSQLLGKVYIDLRDSDTSEKNYDDLLQTLHGVRMQAPDIGSRPDFSSSKAYDSTSNREHEISQKWMQGRHRIRRLLVPLILTLTGLIFLAWAGLTYFERYHKSTTVSPNNGSSQTKSTGDTPPNPKPTERPQSTPMVDPPLVERTGGTAEEGSQNTVKQLLRSDSPSTAHTFTNALPVSSPQTPEVQVPNYACRSGANNLDESRCQECERLRGVILNDERNGTIDSVGRTSYYRNCTLAGISLVIPPPAPSAKLSAIDYRQCVNSRSQIADFDQSGRLSSKTLNQIKGAYKAGFCDRAETQPSSVCERALKDWQDRGNYIYKNQQRAMERYEMALLQELRANHCPGF